MPQPETRLRSQRRRLDSSGGAEGPPTPEFGAAGGPGLQSLGSGDVDRRKVSHLVLRQREPDPIVEALWWHEDLDADPAHAWLRTALAALGAEL